VADELADRLDAYAETVLASGAASSMAVAVTDGERTLASRSYGVPDGTMFQFGSIGKSFTAILALQLAERGLLDLHAPVADVLPWFTVGGTTAPITLHHLLTHSSGLIQGAEIATGSNYDVVALADTEVGFAPGEHLWYSNVGYRVIGWMLERVSGHGYPRLVSERILGPLGMAHSTYAQPLPGTLASRAATGHEKNGKEKAPLGPRRQPFSSSETPKCPRTSLFCRPRVMSGMPGTRASAAR